MDGGSDSAASFGKKRKRDVMEQRAGEASTVAAWIAQTSHPLSHSLPAHEPASVNIGIIGAGQMGNLYARRFAQGGFQVYLCDRPDRFHSLKEQYRGVAGVTVCEDGADVSRMGHIIIYSVEMGSLEAVVKMYGKCTRAGAIVAGQSSVKAPEIAAFESHLPQDVHIITVHSLHAGDIDTKGQTLVFMPHRAAQEAVDLAKWVFETLESRMITMPCARHDEITADTQVVTHVALMSMGFAWCRTGVYPWEDASYSGGIENIKVLSTLRLFSAKAHIYEGLAMNNPYGERQVLQYAKSVSHLFKLMLMQKEDKLKKRIQAGRDYVFGKRFGEWEGSGYAPVLLLPDDTLAEYSLAPPHLKPSSSSGSVSSQTKQNEKTNSHLCLLAMVDSWYEVRNYMSLYQPIYIYVCVCVY